MPPAKISATEVFEPTTSFNIERLNFEPERMTLPVVLQPEPPPPPPKPVKRVVAQKKPLTYTQSGDAYGTAIRLYRDNTNNCVAWIKKQTGIYRTLGNGARAGIQGQEPRVGAVGSVKGAVHAVLVVAVNGNQITIHESNYVRGWITQRTLPLSMFLGFIYS